MPSKNVLPFVAPHGSALGDKHSLEDIVDRYVFNRLPPSAREAFETHLLICGACRAEVQLSEAICLALRIAIRQTKMTGPYRKLHNKEINSPKSIAA